MKRSIALACTAFASCNAVAQSDVILSGGMVIGFRHLSARADGTPSQNRIDNLDAGGNFLMLRGSEDLGSGLKANFLLQYRFNPDDGSTGAGHDFYANTKLGLAGPYGEVSVGRFWAPVDFLIRPLVDVYTPLGLGVTVYGGPLDASTRYNGMIMYESPEIRGFKAGIAFVPKAEMISNNVNTTEVALRYRSGPLAMGIGFTKNAGIGASARDNAEGKDVLTVGGAYDFKVAKVGLTLSRVDAFGITPKSDRWSTAVRVPLRGGVRLKAGYEDQGFDGGTSTKAVALGAEYDLSKRTMLFTEAGKIDSDIRSRDETGWTYIAGIRHRF